MDRYINLEDISVALDSDIEYCKLTGRFERIRTLTEIREEAEKLPYIEFPKPQTTETEPIMYLHTEERE